MSIGLGALGLSIVAGSLTTLSPCVLPILPLVVGGAVQRNKAAPMVMGLGMVVSFSMLGGLVGWLGASIGLNADILRTVGAVLMVLFGAAMLIPSWSLGFGRVLAPISSSANAVGNRLGESLFGSFLLGGLLGMVWSPCSGPLLAGALTLVASQGSVVQGILVLGLFGLGAAMPLVAVAYVSRAGFNRSRHWLSAKTDALKKVFAVFLMLVGASILSGFDKKIEAWVLDFLPDAWVNLTVLF